MVKPGIMGMKLIELLPVHGFEVLQGPPEVVLACPDDLLASVMVQNEPFQRGDPADPFGSGLGQLLIGESEMREPRQEPGLPVLGPLIARENPDGVVRLLQGAQEPHLPTLGDGVRLVTHVAVELSEHGAGLAGDAEFANLVAIQIGADQVLCGERMGAGPGHDFGQGAFTQTRPPSEHPPRSGGLGNEADGGAQGVLRWEHQVLERLGPVLFGEWDSVHNPSKIGRAGRRQERKGFPSDLLLNGSRKDMTSARPRHIGET
jgi:hypothetical protein